MRRASSGAGALCDFGSHLIDLTDYVAGQRYREVSCMADTFIPMRRLDQQMAPVENDDAAAFLARGDHSIGNFCVSRTGMDDAMLLVTGVGGMVQLSLRGSEQVTYLEKHSGRRVHRPRSHSITPPAAVPPRKAALTGRRRHFWMPSRGRPRMWRTLPRAPMWRRFSTPPSGHLSQEIRNQWDNAAPRRGIP